MFYSPFNRSCLQFFRQRVHTSRQWGGTHYHMTHRPKCAFVFVLLVSYLFPYLLEICSDMSGPLVFKVGISLVTCREEAGLRTIAVFGSACHI